MYQSITIVTISKCGERTERQVGGLDELTTIYRELYRAEESFKTQDSVDTFIATQVRVTGNVKDKIYAHSIASLYAGWRHSPSDSALGRNTLYKTLRKMNGVFETKTNNRIGFSGITVIEPVAFVEDSLDEDGLI